MKKEEIKKVVREGYGKIAKQLSSRLCCGSPTQPHNSSKEIGYSREELKTVPQGTVSFGCGNPIALASLRDGETVLDLGSGAGFDCFLAANKVGNNGRVIGIDMTSEMIAKARTNARKSNYKNVEFRLGDIEALPVKDNTVDIIISNCVINLSPDKEKVFKEAFRVLKPGGRLMVSDMVLVKELLETTKNSIKARIACLSGAIRKEEYLLLVKEAGFKDVKILDEAFLPIELMIDDPTVKAQIDSLNIPLEIMREIGHSTASIKVYGVKPA